MLYYAVVFFIIALIAALFGFGGIAAGAAGIAKILFVVFLIVESAILRDRNAALFSNQFDGFRKRELLQRHHKRKNVPSGAAAETMKKLFISMNRERRRLFGVKRAKPL